MAKDGKTTLSADKINRGQVKKEKQNLILFFFTRVFIADGGSPVFVCQKTSSAGRMKPINLKRRLEKSRRDLN